MATIMNEKKPVICLDAGHYAYYNQSPANRNYWESKAMWKLTMMQKKYLEELGFEVIPSKANFVFAKHPEFRGKDLYLALREKGILVRHFDKPRLNDYNRITIGSKEQMKALVKALTEILEVSP